jgi:hypothetical protein
MKFNRFFFPILLVLIWLITILVINPIGNFPLNDDWQYARPVLYLVTQGHYYSPDAYSPILIAQVYWGALFCLPGGFSFTALRFSSLVMGIAGVLGFYYLINYLTRNKMISFIGAFILLTNPFYLLHAHSFMTDIPFLTLAIFSIFLYFKSLQTGEMKFVIAATITVIIATLIRQFCVVIPFAYGVAALFKYRPKPLQAFKHFIPALLAVAAYNIGLWWLKHIGSELRPYEGGSVLEFIKNPADVAEHIFERTGHILHYSAFFLFPIIVYRFRGCLRDLSTKEKRIALIFPIPFIPSLLSMWHQLPYGPILRKWVLGAVSLKTDDVPNVHPPFDILLNILIAIAFIGAILLLINVGTIIAKLVTAYKTKTLSNISLYQIFILGTMLGYALLLYVPVFFFDRYTSLFVPLFLLLLFADGKESKPFNPFVFALSLAFLLFIGYFSTTATHDYLAWNRARWAAANHLILEEHISVHRIEGGKEFNGWFMGLDFPPGTSTPNPDLSEYVIAHNNLKGYKIVGQYPYQNYFPYETRNVYILHKQ